MDTAELTRSIFLGTLPILATSLGFLAIVVWNLIEVKGLRGRFDEEIPGIRELLAKIEQRLDDAHVGPSIVPASH